MRPHNGLYIKEKLFEEVDISQPFFDSFRRSYPGFNDWASRKRKDNVYVVEHDGQVVGFLKLKIEDETEDYSDMTLPFPPKRRLKVCSLKSTIPGLGMPFMELTYLMTMEYGVDEVYLTINNPSMDVMKFFFKNGFVVYGNKITNNLTETVYRYECNYPTNQKTVQ